MEFGKVVCLDDILWNLPPAPEIKNNFEASRVSLHIGTTGWGEKKWVGHLYPNGTKPADFLSRYAEVFDTIELNTTHYQIPNHAGIERWYKQSIEDFTFCPKIPRIISHHKKLGVGTGYIPMFCQSITGLAEKLGPCFLQLPPTFHPNDLAILTAFFKEWPEEISLHIEFRHAAWFAIPFLDKIREILSAAKKGVVMTDVAGRRDVLRMAATSEIVFIRFVGNSGHTSDLQRINHWMSTLSEWTKSGITEIYFFLHQPDAGHIPSMYHHIKIAQMAFQDFKNNRTIDFWKGQSGAGQLKLF
jgi:uncharacterized protein YecE (DUF72 family)